MLSIRTTNGVPLNVVNVSDLVLWQGMGGWGGEWCGVGRCGVSSVGGKPKGVERRGGCVQ